MKLILKRNLLRVGGWIRNNYNPTFNDKRGIIIIESLVYVFLTTLILAQGINLFSSIYGFYLKEQQETIKYNKYQIFFINLDNIIARGGYEKLTVINDSLLFFATEKMADPYKVIKFSDGDVVVGYMSTNKAESVNIMIKDISDFKIKKKGKLIYLMIKDIDGKEFIKCI